MVFHGQLLQQRVVDDVVIAPLSAARSLIIATNIEIILEIYFILPSYLNVFMNIEPIMPKKSFQELSTDELYELLRVRSEVFVIEQNCDFFN